MKAGQEQEQILGRLRQIKLFDEIKNHDEFMNALLKICKMRHSKAREIIIQEGETGSEMFIVHKGGVEILKRTRAGDNYTVIKLKAEQNVFFGELGLIDDDKRSATVTATEDSDFIVISKDDFIKLGDTLPFAGLVVTRAISIILAGRLRKTTTDMLTIFDALVNEIST
ncbi:MAG: cyclic nucleotide-binding domain-containing protein [Spirochaetales bacterium]|nr:MAG: cyclic nucleotide-binding domain-containing protein [Spirochaetales bacterium]